MNPRKIKVNSKNDVLKFYETHFNCNINSENYGGTIELVFCKDHAEYNKPNQITRPKGTYIFIDTSKE